MSERSWEIKHTRTILNCWIKMEIHFWLAQEMLFTTSAWRIWRRTWTRGSSGTPGPGTRSCAWWRASPRTTVTTTSEFSPNKATTVYSSVEPIRTILAAEPTWRMQRVFMRWQESTVAGVIVLTTRDTTQRLCLQVGELLIRLLCINSTNTAHHLDCINYATLILERHAPQLIYLL